MKRRNEQEHPLLQMVQEGFNVMNAYINSDSKCEVIIDRQPTSQHLQGPPSYDMVIQTYQNMEVYFQHISTVLPTRLPELVTKYNDLVRMCEEKRRSE